MKKMGDRFTDLQMKTGPSLDQKVSGGWDAAVLVVG